MKSGTHQANAPTANVTQVKPTVTQTNDGLGEKISRILNRFIEIKHCLLTAQLKILKTITPPPPQ